jgi:hypothetical protein
MTNTPSHGARHPAVLERGFGDALEPLPKAEARRRRDQALAHEERSVSASRQAVLRVHDRVQEELKRRFREEPSTVRPG